MVALQQEKERISGGLSPASSFSLSAPEHEIAVCELALGLKFDPEHRRFLQHANGWDGFSASADLFSTTDFLGSARFKTAQEWIKLMDKRVLGPYAKKRSALFPIGKSAVSTDLLLMLNEGG
ncbi:MAG: SMI1/KNR4 family protein, partial [Alphaproteobacteria bacterium]